MRTIRDLNKLIAELETHESEWKHTSLAARNRLLLKRWKEQRKVREIFLENHPKSEATRNNQKFVQPQWLHIRPKLGRFEKKLQSRQ